MFGKKKEVDPVNMGQKTGEEAEETKVEESEDKATKSKRVEVVFIASTEKQITEVVKFVQDMMTNYGSDVIKSLTIE